MKADKTIFWLFRLLILFWTFYGAHAWFTWFMSMGEFFRFTQFLTLLTAVVSILYHKTYVKKSFWNKRNIIVFILFEFLSLRADFSITYFLSAFICIPVLVLLDDIKNSYSHLKFIATTLSAIIVPGLILHFLFIFSFLPTSVPIVYPGSFVYVFSNYLFVLEGLIYEQGSGRFMSIFLEPGYFATLSVFLLYALKFNFKLKQVKIITVGILCSLSLFGYGAFAISYLYYKGINGVKIQKYLVILIAMVFFVSVFKDLNGGHNIINEKILSRLESDDERGFAGNNRVGEGVDTYFDYYLGTGDLIQGVGNDEIRKINDASTGSFGDSIRGAGYKIFFIREGIIAAVAYLFIYLLMALYKIPKAQKLYSYGFVVLIIITFIQASYPSSFSWLVPFVLGISSYRKQIN